VDDDDARARGFERVLTEWDSVLFGKIVGVRTIHRDGWTCSAMLPGTVHDGTEGELFDHANDPLQQRNLWDDPRVRALRDDLLADMWASFPAASLPRRSCDAPV
jgi:hypothetical protein